MCLELNFNGNPGVIAPPGEEISYCFNSLFWKNIGGNLLFNIQYIKFLNVNNAFDVDIL